MKLELSYLLKRYESLPAYIADATRDGFTQLEQRERRKLMRVVESLRSGDYVNDLGLTHEQVLNTLLYGTHDNQSTSPSAPDQSAQ